MKQRACKTLAHSTAGAHLQWVRPKKHTNRGTSLNRCQPRSWAWQKKNTCAFRDTTFQGICRAAASDQTVIGIPVLKIKEEDQLLFQQQQISKAAAAKQVILFDHAGAGYAKTSAQQLDFMNLFYQKTGIPTDIVYTGKLMQAVLQLAEKNYFTAADHIVVLHTGGLQGNNSVADGRLLF